MSKALDYLSLTVIIFIFTFIWTATLFSGWVVAVIFSAAITFIVVVTVKYASERKNKPYSPDRLALEISMRGNEYLIELIKSTIKIDTFDSTSNAIITDNEILIANFKFNLLNITDLTQSIRLAKKYGKKEISIMCRGIDRHAYQVIQLADVKVRAIKIRQIYKHLQKNSALPDLKRAKNKFSFALLIEKIFQRSNTKNFMFSGVILISVAFLTPFKTYYLTFGSISLLFALLTLTPIGKGTFKTAQIFDTLSRNKNNQTEKSDTTIPLTDVETSDIEQDNIKDCSQNNNLSENDCHKLKNNNAQTDILQKSDSTSADSEDDINY